MAEHLNNSYTQPAAPDAILAAEHTIGSGVVALVAPIEGFEATGRIKIGTTAYKVTDLGAGDVNLVVEASDGTSDGVYAAGTPVYVVVTRAGLEAAIQEAVDAIDLETEGSDLYLAANFT